MAVGILWDPLAPRIHIGFPESTGEALSWLLHPRSATRADYLNNLPDALVALKGQVMKLPLCLVSYRFARSFAERNRKWLRDRALPRPRSSPRVFE